MFRPLPPWPTLYVYVGLTAFVLAAFLMPAGIALLRRAGAIDAVSETKIHTRPTPRGGGIVIFAAFAFAVLLPNYRDNPMKGVLAGAFLCLLVGAWDDIRGGVPAVVKFGALVASTLVMAYFGVRLQLFHYLPLDLAVTLLWIVGVTSAFNGLDNMDGLAGGVAVIVSAMYLVIAFQTHYLAGTETSLSWFGLLAAGLIGANLGFLLYNVKPAKVFMGDAGSFFLGFTLAALGVMGEWNEHPVIAATIPVLILGIPIFDFAFILAARMVRGETRDLRAVIEHCATDHLSHRLVWMGFSERKAVLLIYLMCLVLGISGVLLRDSDSNSDIILALFQGGAIVFIIVMLMAAAAGQQLRSVQREVRQLADESEPEPARSQLADSGRH